MRFRLRATLLDRRPRDGAHAPRRCPAADHPPDRCARGCSSRGGWRDQQRHDGVRRQHPVLAAARTSSSPRSRSRRRGRTVEAREYAIAGTYFNGLQIVDITDPENPDVTSVWDCGILQGDVQVFTQGDRTLATYTSEDTTRRRRIRLQC
jgi:hypothetical protein